MAELIDKDEALKLFDNCAFQTMNYVTVKGRLNSLPTTTEAEIRAKAIDEFAEKLKWEFENSIGVSKRAVYFANAVIDIVAKELKEE